MLAGWTVLRFTWEDVYRRPRWVVAQVGAALQKLRLTHASDAEKRAFLEVFGG
jgi:very-short-patch-repair endonuclease